MRGMGREEAFMRAQPPAPDGRLRETDFFEGLV